MASIKTLMELDDSQFQNKIRQAQEASSTLGSKLTAVGRTGEEAFKRMSNAADAARSRVDSLVSVLV